MEEHNLATRNVSNKYLDASFSYNSLRMSSRGYRWYFSGATTLNTRRRYKEVDQITRQALSTVIISGDTAKILVEKKAFAAAKPQPYVFGFKVQSSLYLEKVKIGADATLQWQDSNTADHTWAATASIFFPVSAGDATVILMPQAKWTQQEKWVIGFNVSASLPCFLTKDSAKS